MITTPRQTTRRYDIVPHADIPGLAGQIHALAAVAFGAYPGVLAPHLAHREWYIRRPGMDRDLSMGILCDGRLVASVFVTQAPVRLGGRPLSLGIVDTVMSHPDHRRQGLARWALGAAVDAMRERGLAGSLLYTVEDSMPAHFYESMGYVAHVPVRYYRAPRTARPTGHPSPRPAEPAETDAVIRFLNGALAAHDGYIPVDQPLWQWRRLGRPAELPASTWVIDSPGGYSGCVTACRARVVAGGGGEAACNVLTDLALAPGADPRATIAALLGVVPGGCEARTLSADTEEPVNATLEELGFSVTAREVAMVLPLSPEAAGATRGRAAHWYALAESVIGV